MVQKEDNTFPHSAETIVATLIKMFEAQNNKDIASLLTSAYAQIEATDYDNWNGGTYLYSLSLDVPIGVFGEIEPRISEIEESILNKATTIFRNLVNQKITKVIITPPLASDVSRMKADTFEGDADHLWTPKYLRLFLSHVAIHKKNVGELKNELQVYGISAFVAHEDIEPSVKWQDEILKALQSMHVMVALLTPEFHQSNWTDQEMGIALGRRILVIPVRLGLDPYGFVGSQQGLAGTLRNTANLASQLADVLLKQQPTASLMRESLVVGLEESFSFATSDVVSRKISGVSDFTESQLNRLEVASRDNFQVSQSYNVPQRIQGVVRRQKPIEDDDDLP